jgi:hypothetical protein
MQRQLLLLAFFALAACQNQSEKVVYRSIRAPKYDTVFQPAYLAAAQPAIFEKAFGVGTTDSSDSVEFGAEQLDSIRIESGRITACDMVQVSNATPFAATFPRGSFPVQVAIAHYKNYDERIAFCRIFFSRQPVASWTMAVWPGTEPLSPFDSSFYGYGVDGGIGMFIDSLAQRELNSQFDKDPELSSKIFITEMDKHSRPTWDYVVYPFSNHNLAAFSTGMGDGRYASYIGYDSAGRICRLLTDFDLVDWFHAKPAPKTLPGTRF